MVYFHFIERVILYHLIKNFINFKIPIHEISKLLTISIFSYNRAVVVSIKKHNLHVDNHW